MEYISLVSEWVALLVAIFYFNRYRHSVLKWCLPFLIMICLVEATGWYLRKILNHNNAFIYGVSIPIEYCFYLFLFYNHIANALFRKIILLFGVFVFFLALLSLLSLNRKGFNYDILLIGNCTMIVTSCFYFWDLFNTEQDESLFNIPFFWLAAGVFLFNIGEISYSMFAKRWTSLIDTNTNFLRFLLAILSPILYSSYIKTLSFPKHAYTRKSDY